MNDTVTVHALPFPLTPAGDTAWTVDTTTVSATAPADTDIFTDPARTTDPSIAPKLNAPTLLGAPPSGDFQLRARVTVDFESTFDAGVLLLWIDDQHWGKLCFEYSPGGEPMVVSVVTRGVSDDANGFVVDGRTVWLRVSRVDHTYAYHASLDGKTWNLVRYFALGHASDSANIGFQVQSPTGSGCAVVFDAIAFTTERLVDMRGGS
ncbi:DUF1349 domain-containing protein [Streptomyces sp. NPDC097640]|uniref:DUF1349 domain-containing protein n=1 Tax=Streptomyces sp. NPDC097640 TaxID=3157229 RepID=UPI00331FA665